MSEKERYWVKEYDSMNPDKGYNMTEGGEGGRQSPEVIKKMSEAGTKKWHEKEYRGKQGKERQERAKDPAWLKKITDINRKRGQDPEWRKRVSEAGKKKYREDPEYREKQAKERRERAKDPEWREKMREIGKQ
ncbi:unnamed protein product, partial [marine sediment metagenome]